MKKPQRIECDVDELQRIVDRASLSDDDRATLRAAVETLAFLSRELEAKRVSVRRLQSILFGARTEKTRKVLGTISDESHSPEQRREENVGEPPRAPSAGAVPGKKRKGHGRRSASAYRGAERIVVPHATLCAGAACPECTSGKLRLLGTPRQIVRVTGQAPIAAKLYELERLRCNTCGAVVTASPPADIGDEKYDVATAVMIAVLKYGLGLPFYRLARLQQGIEIPLPSGTQWQVLTAHLAGPAAVFAELVQCAAQADVLHNDDTTAKVLSLLRRDAKSDTANDSSPPSREARERTGVFTSGIVAIKGDHRIALFFTGRHHAGENLAEVLRHRAMELAPPLQMCDALSRNLPKDFETILCNCLAHGRRGFVDVVAKFPSQCRHVLETLRDVYRFDELARSQHLDADARLAWHQERSAPLMRDLETWFAEQLAEKHVEPNAGLGEAIRYMQKHWHALTQFLRVPGAPLDNTIVERAIKRVILHRKNALFFRTEHGAEVGDIFLSLIHTAELCHVSPVAYLRALMENAKAATAAPSQWLPWNYQAALAVAA